MVEELINQPTLVRLRIPIKIYGDLHGRYGGNLIIQICLNYFNNMEPQMKNMVQEIQKNLTMYFQEIIVILALIVQK